MTITATYPGICPTCSKPISPGDRIEWSKGAKATHTTCPTVDAPRASVSAPDRKRRRASSSTPARARSSARTPPPAGPMMRNDRSPYERGDVLTCQLSAREIAECEARQSITAIEVAGDKPIRRSGDRRIAVVVIHTDRMRQDDADDNGYCGRYGAVVRLATTAEAASLVAERAAKAQAQADAAARGQAWSAQLAALTAARVLVEGGQIDRAGAEVLHEERRGLRGTVSARWSRLADGSIAQETYAYDDERWGRWVTVDQLLELARVSDRTLEDAIRGQRYSALDRAIVWLAAQAGQSPRPPVTVILHGLEQPVTLAVRLSRASGLIVAEPMGGGSVRITEGDAVHVAYEWAWPVDRLRDQLNATAPPEAFSDLEFAPGAELGGDRLALPQGLWIDGMRAALAEIAA